MKIQGARASKVSMKVVKRASCALVVALALGGAAPSTHAQDLDALRTAANANRRDAAAQRAYGIALIRAERFNEAERVMRAAARLQDDSLESLYDVARVAFATGEYRKSRAACRALERKERNAVLTRVCRARAFLVWNRSGRAFEELEAAIAADPNHFEAQLAVGDANRLRHHVAEAEQAYRRAISIDGQRYEPHHGLGQLYAQAGRDQEAIAALRAAMQRDARVPQIWYQLATHVGGDEGRRLLARAVAERPEWVQALVALADLERAAGDAAARGHYESALQQDERNAAAHVGLGTMLVDAGELDAAEPHLRRALELVPNSPDVALQLGKIAERRDDFREAFAQYRHAADLAPSRPVGLLYAAALALRTNRDVLATGYLDRYLQVHANGARALALYGDAMRARRDRAGAARYYERALQGEGEFDRARVQAALREVRTAAPTRRRVGRATR